MAEPFEFDFNEAGLKGKCFILSGGAGGLGSASAVLLARDGASLVIGYKANRERAEALKSHLVKTYGTRVQLVGGDICDEDIRSSLLAAAEELEEPLQGLVCFSGNPARVKFDDATAEQMHDSLSENYVAPALLGREAARAMRDSGSSGSVVFFSTMQAVALFSGSINYAGPKVALIHAARTMAKEWGGPNGIRVNVVAPGVNRAGMALSSIASGKYDFFVDEGIIPRFGRPEDTARVVRLLLEPDNYITGQVITVDGGLTIRRD